jgi:hypothetical protein
MERATKLLVIGWACAALAADVWLSLAWSGMPVTTTLLFAAAAALTAFDRRAIALVLVFAYVFPAVIRLTLDTYAVQFSLLWLAPLLGAVVPDGVRTRWHIPARFRGALVCAALTIAVATTIVALRETDFNLALLGPMPGAVLSGLPRFFAEWVVSVGLVLVLGILWFDWLIGARQLDFHSAILAPLGASLSVMALVAIYQMFVNMSFMNETIYAFVGRAGGTLYDANVCGTIAAMGVGAAAYFAERRAGWRRALSLCGILVCLLAVWASGSRTAFIATMIVTGACVMSLKHSVDRSTAMRVAKRAWLPALAVVSLFAVIASADLAAIGPIRRLWSSMPGVSGNTVSSFLLELWNRNGYGAAASTLIREFPVSGIGVGGFHMFGPLLGSGITLPTDNAQSWYRHQLTEFGILGTLGWLAFVVTFGWFVVRPGRVVPASAWIVRGLLLAFAVIALVGMPTQEIAAALTFWTAAAWYVRIAGADAGVSGVEAPLRPWVWWLVAAIVLSFGASTFYAATSELRVPARARRVGWPYSHGFYWPEPDGAGGEFRWAQQRATALIDAPARWMTISAWVTHADVSRKPVDVKVWVEGRPVIDTRLTKTEPVTATVQLPAGFKQALVDTWVSRAIRPSDLGIADNRELGLAVRWRFDAQPPSSP